MGEGYITYSLAILAATTALGVKQETPGEQETRDTAAALAIAAELAAGGAGLIWAAASWRCSRSRGDR